MTLLHWAEFWHDWEHAARLSCFLDELSKYPLFATWHPLPGKVTALPGEAVVGWSADLTLTVRAPLTITRLSHVVLK